MSAFALRREEVRAAWSAFALRREEVRAARSALPLRRGELRAARSAFALRREEVRAAQSAFALRREKVQAARSAFALRRAKLPAARPALGRPPRGDRIYGSPWLETAAPSRGNFRQIQAGGYLEPKYKNDRPGGRYQTVKKVADKLAGCNEGRSALHLKSAGGGMYVAEERQNAASSIIFWP